MTTTIYTSNYRRNLELYWKQFYPNWKIPKGFHVHHIVPQSFARKVLGWDEDKIHHPRNLIALHPNDHIAIHYNRGDYVAVIKLKSYWGTNYVVDMSGENNPFYKKSHSEESKKKMSEYQKSKIMRTSSISKIKHWWNNTPEGEKAKERHKKAKTNIPLSIEHKQKIINYNQNPIVRKAKSEKAKKYIEENYDDIYTDEWRLNQSKRLKGKSKSEETKKKMSEYQKGRKHHWQDKINKNPNKIRKTAEKHCGMKRSNETKKRISDAVRKNYIENGSSTKGRIWIHNPHTNQRKMILPTDAIPEGYVEGYGKRK